MSFPHSADLLARAAAIRLVGFDIDGTLTDGRLVYDSAGRELKAFHSQDGMGISLLRRHGIAVAFVTARRSPVVELRGAELGIEHVCTHEKDKLGRMRALAAEQGLDLSQVAFMGDDLPDLEVLKAVGLSAAPADAHGWTAAQVHYVTPRAGGQGAARDLCDLLLEAQGHAAALRETGAHG